MWPARGDHRAADRPARCDDAPVTDDPPPPHPGWAAQQPPPHPGWQQPYPPQPSGQPSYPQQRGWHQPPPGWGAMPGFPPPPPKPGIIPLRPLGVAEVLDGAITALRTHWRIMLGLSAVVAAVTQVLTVPLTWALLHDAPQTTLRFDQPTSPGGDLAFAASAVTSTAVQGLVTVLAVLVLTGVLTAAVSRAVLGEPTSAREAWDRARPRLPALLGVTGLLLVLGVGLAVVCLAPGVLLAAAGAPAPVTALAFVLGVPAFVVALVYAYTAFALAPPAVVLERQGVLASLRRSRELVAGAWWRTFGILLLVNVLAQVLSGILGTPFSLAAMGLAVLADSSVFSLVPLLVTALGTILAATITWPFTAVATTLLYVDRRMRREALDLELVRAAGLAGTGPAGAPAPHPHR